MTIVIYYSWRASEQRKSIAPSLISRKQTTPVLNEMNEKKKIATILLCGQSITATLAVDSTVLQHL